MTSVDQANLSDSSLQAPIFVISQAPNLHTSSLPTSRLALNDGTKAQVRTCMPVRIIIGILGIVACMIMSSVRYNLSVAIVAMVEDSCTPQMSVCGKMKVLELAASEHKLNTTLPTIMKSNDLNISVFTEILLLSLEDAPGQQKQNDIRSHVRQTEMIEKLCTGEAHKGSRLNWTDIEQGVALGSYYYGFAPMHIFGGRLAERFGAKWVLFIGLIGAAIANAFLPLIAVHSFAGFIFVRYGTY